LWASTRKPSRKRLASSISVILARGLRREGVDGVNGKLLQGPSHLGGLLPPTKLFLESPVRIIALKGTVTILINGKRDPISG